MKKVSRILACSLLLAVMLSVVLVVPSGATVVGDSVDKPCSCNNSFTGTYAGGIVDGLGDTVNANAHITHICDGCDVYVSAKCWVYTSNYNNYTSRTFTASRSGNYSATVELNKDLSSLGFSLRAVETYHKIHYLCEGEEFTIQRWISDGNVPLSIQPPVVTE